MMSKKSSEEKQPIWNQSDYKLEIVSDCDKLPLDEIIKFLESRYNYFYAYAIHDKDITYNEAGIKVPRLPHFHLLIWSKNDKTNLSLQKLKDEFNIPDNMFQKVHSKLKAIQYLIHQNENENEKYHYSRNIVVSNCDDIQCYFDRTDGLPALLVDYLNDKITYYEVCTGLLPRDYSKYKTLINNTYEQRNISKKNRNLQVIYITGASGSGKTTLAKYLADKYKLSCYITGSNNDPLENYKGESCIVLDDYRSNTFAFNDLLKLLDNHTNSAIRSRYCNKYITDCKLIIITSIKSPSELYFNDDTAKDEKLEQLFRRLGHQYYRIEDSLEVNIYSTNDSYLNNTGVDLLDIIPNDFEKEGGDLYVL